MLEDGFWVINESAGITQGTSSFLVPRDTPGLEVTRCNETFGGRFMNNGALGKAGVYFQPGKILVAAKNLGIGIAALLPHAAIAVDEGSPDASTLSVMIKVGIEKYFRDAAACLHSDGTTDVSNFKIVLSMFPETAGLYAGPE